MTPSTRLALWYFATAGALASLPYVSTILSDRGVDDALLPAVLVLTPIGSLVSGPVWAWVADRTGRAQTVLQTASVAAWLACIALALATDGVWFAVALFAFALARAPQFPLADALTVRIAGRDGYGRVRVWGSVAYLLAAMVNGRLEGAGPLWVGVALLAVAVLVTALLPPFDAAPPRPARALLRALWGQPALLPLLVTGWLHGITITTYDTLWSLHVRRLELPGSVTGDAIAAGVGAEVLVLAAAPVLLRRVAPSTLLVIAVAAGVPRFWLTGTLTDPTWLVVVQGAHGLTFGAFWVAGVAIYARMAPRGLEGATQSLLLASTFGAGSFASMGLASVVLRFGTTSDLFHVLAGVAALATAMALWTARARRVQDSVDGPPAG